MCLWTFDAPMLIYLEETVHVIKTFYYRKKKRDIFICYTLIGSSPNVENKLKVYGFKFQTKSNYDHLEVTKRARAMVEFVKQDHDINELKQIAEHNFNLAWDRKFLVELFVEHVKKGQ